MEFTIVSGQTAYPIVETVSAPDALTAAKMAYRQYCNDNNTPYDETLTQYIEHGADWRGPTERKRFSFEPAITVEDCLFVYAGDYPIDHFFDLSARDNISIVQVREFDARVGAEPISFTDPYSLARWMDRAAKRNQHVRRRAREWALDTAEWALMFIKKPEIETLYRDVLGNLAAMYRGAREWDEKCYDDWHGQLYSIGMGYSNSFEKNAINIIRSFTHCTPYYSTDMSDIYTLREHLLWKWANETKKTGLMGRAETIKKIEVGIRDEMLDYLSKKNPAQ